MIQEPILEQFKNIDIEKSLVIEKNSLTYDYLNDI
jgi:hypothetical protein